MKSSSRSTSARADEAKAILRREMLTLPAWADRAADPIGGIHLRVLHEGEGSSAISAPRSRPALLSGARRDVPVRARGGVFHRAARRRQGRRRAHGGRRADPRRTPPAPPRHCAEAGRHHRVAGGGRGLAASPASEHRSPRRKPGAPARAPRHGGRAPGHGDRHRSGAVARC